MVGDEGALGSRRLGRAELHMAIDADRIAGQDLSPKLPREEQRQSSFAGGSGADDDEEWTHTEWLRAGLEAPPATVEQQQRTRAPEQQQKYAEGKPQQPAQLRTTFAPEGGRISLWPGRGLHEFECTWWPMLTPRASREPIDWASFSALSERNLCRGEGFLQVHGEATRPPET